jgi:hypothetical protein
VFTLTERLCPRVQFQEHAPTGPVRAIRCHLRRTAPTPPALKDQPTRLHPRAATPADNARTRPTPGSGQTQTNVERVHAYPRRRQGSRGAPRDTRPRQCRPPASARTRRTGRGGVSVWYTLGRFSGVHCPRFHGPSTAGSLRRRKQPLCANVRATIALVLYPRLKPSATFRESRDTAPTLVRRRAG